ncbi:MAG TPA: hypothetical protein VEO56_01670 [Bacteroidota bacterium]|nr:hypothetical protein [Bacteroidota bacterium]
MKTILVAVALCLTANAWAGQIVIEKISGDVSVRHGVTEVWTQVAPGDILRPDDTMKTGKKGHAILVATSGADASGAQKRIDLPGDVIVDMSDIRDLSQEELMLKLTMEKVRASSYQWKQDDLRIPNAPVIHGEDKGSAPALQANSITTGVMELNGARVLFNNGFFATCALKGMEVFREFPPLAGEFHNRLLVAESLEKANLRGEALSEYGTIASLASLTPEQSVLVRNRMAALRK